MRDAADPNGAFPFSLPFPCPSFRLSVFFSLVIRLPEAVAFFEEVLRSVDEKKRTDIMRSRWEVLTTYCTRIRFLFVFGRLVAYVCATIAFEDRSFDFCVMELNACWFHLCGFDGDCSDCDCSAAKAHEKCEPIVTALKWTFMH